MNIHHHVEVTGLFFFPFTPTPLPQLNCKITKEISFCFSQVNFKDKERNYEILYHELQKQSVKLSPSTFYSIFYFYNKQDDHNGARGTHFYADILFCQSGQIDKHIQKVQIITLYGMYGMCRIWISFISTKSLKPLVNLIRRRQYSLEHTTKHRIRKQVKQMAVTDPTCKNIAYCINHTTLEPSISQHVFSQKQQKCCLTQGRVPKFVQCEKIILDQRLQSCIFKMQ